MRINLINLKKGTQAYALAKHLIQLAADDYQVNAKDLHKHLATGMDVLGEQIAQVLSSKGWQISWYRLCHPDSSDHLGLDMFVCLSCGFLIHDACDLLIQWRLQHAPGYT